MLQISFIRQHIELVKDRLSVRYFDDLSIVDKVVSLDEQVRKLKVASETLQAEMNASSKEIGLLMGKGEKALAEEKKQQVTKLKDRLSVTRTDLLSLEDELKLEVLKLPNLPHASVKQGKTPDENEVIKEGGTMPALPENAQPH